MTPSVDLKSLLWREAQSQGLAVMGVTGTDTSATPLAQRLEAFIGAGYHGDMAWMAETAARRGAPRQLWADARSVIMLGLSYAPSHNPLEALAKPKCGAISVYAQGRDYHEILKSKLKAVARAFAKASGADVKVFVDTAPLMEKPLAQLSGLGWQGKHTNLVSRTHGSWLFLGAILTTAELEPDAPEPDHCGSCTRCLDICPTNAFPAPYRLDARRCIAYLTIEHKGHIDGEFRKSIGNRVFGCDDCLAVCPWNKFAENSREARFAPNSATNTPALAWLLELDDQRFRDAFRGTPIKRAGRDRIVRNALIAAGNSQDAALIPHVVRLLGDTSPLVRAMAVWALGELLEPKDFNAARAAHLPGEIDAHVRGEWEHSNAR